MEKDKNLISSFVLENEWWHRFAWARILIGGEWVKTKERGWIPCETYCFYCAYGFDPIVLKEEKTTKIKKPAT